MLLIELVDKEVVGVVVGGERMENQNMCPERNLREKSNGSTMKCKRGTAIIIIDRFRSVVIQTKQISE